MNLMILKRIKIKLIVFLILGFLLVGNILFSIFISDNSKSKETKKVMTLNIAKELTLTKFGNLNEINKIANDLEFILKKYEKNGEFEEVETKHIIFKENSFLFLLLMSTAFRESTFRTYAIGPKGELSAFQFKTSTARYLIKKRSLPVNFNLKNIRAELRNNKKATHLAIYYIKMNLSQSPDLVSSMSKYNGDKSQKYGHKIKRTFEFILNS